VLAGWLAGSPTAIHPFSAADAVRPSVGPFSAQTATELQTQLNCQLALSPLVYQRASVAAVVAVVVVVSRDAELQTTYSVADLYRQLTDRRPRPGLS